MYRIAEIKKILNWNCVSFIILCSVEFRLCSSKPKSKFWMKQLISINIKCGYYCHKIFLLKKFNSIFKEYENMKGEQVSISKFSIKILTLRTWINNDNTTFKAYCHAGREESSITIFILLLLLTNTLSQWINLHQV